MEMTEVMYLLYDVGVALPGGPIDGAVPLEVQLTQVSAATAQDLIQR
jgi:hypothetical protein